MNTTDIKYKPESVGVDEKRETRERSDDETNYWPAHHPRLHEPTRQQPLAMHDRSKLHSWRKSFRN